MADSPSLMTPRVRLAFSYQLFEPKSVKGGNAKYGCSLIFDAAAQATPQFAALDKAWKDCAIAKWGAEKLKAMKCKGPFLDGSLPEYAQYDGFDGCKFIRVTTLQAPGFASAQATKVDPAEAGELFYSGAFVRATVNPFAYDTDGNRGVSFGLRNLQFMAHGDSIGGRTSADQDFTAVEDDGGDVDGLFSQ